MPTNQTPAYKKANERYLNASTDEERIEALEEMIRECPKHKSSENMLANLKTRYKKLKNQLLKSRKSRKSVSNGIKKEEMQAVIVGRTNSGKSSLLSLLTNAHPKISSVKFTTTKPIVGMMNYFGANIQLIENPPIESEYYDKGLPHTADTLLVLVASLQEISEILQELEKHPARKIIVFNKIDLFSEKEITKINATLRSKKYDFVLISTKTERGIKELKDKLFKSFGKIRVYTKEPGKEKSNLPVILEPDSTVKKVAEKILKELSEKIKEARIWGPSSKFPGQIVGLQHQLKDLDTIEFKTK